MRKINIWYLDHSGFAVESEDNIYIFDYFTNSSKVKVRSLATGVINPEEIKDKNVYVFSSHSHYDHFNPVILRWNNLIPNIKYYFSSDINIKRKDSNIMFLDPCKSFNDNNLFIKTLESTDLGIAFYIEDNNISIFHAGDLNWWHWIGETKEYNNNMEIKYKSEIDKLKSYNIDIAFIPVDPRLDEFYYLGIKYFLNNINVKSVFPMHFQKDYSIFSRLENALDTDNYNKIKKIIHRGQKFTIEK